MGATRYVDFEKNVGITFGVHTLDSGIDVAPGINIAPGTFGKNIKRSP